jgi:heat shock protein HslJ
MLQALPIIIRTALMAGAAKAITNIYKNRDMGVLSGTHWRIIVKNKPHLKQNLTFKDSEISGFGGCNQFFGQYRQHADRLTIGALASTRKAGEHMAEETKLLTALQSARRFKGTPSEIKIYGESDNVLLTLKRSK